MKRRVRLRALSLLVAAVNSFPLHAETAGEASPLDHTSPVVIGHSVTLHSSILDEDRQILIHFSGDAETLGQPLPVIYLLDGRAHFSLTAATVDLLTINGRMPRSMVVGIANPDRGRDFTPPETEGRPGGRADAFLDFIESELMPFVDGNFPTAPHRTLIGHSLGGSFVVHAFSARPNLFQAAIAISPAIFNGEVLEGSPGELEPLEAVLEQRDDRPFSLFITMAEGEGPRAETGLEALLGTLRSNVPESFDWEFRRMEGEDHGTTVHPSTYHGLRFINADWDTTGLVRTGSFADLVRRFDRLTERLGTEVRPPEVMLNLLGYRLLGEGRGKEAIEVFEETIRLYSDSANAHDSLGEALERQGKLPGAMLNYRKAVQRAEADDDRRLPIFRANLERVEALLFGGASGPGRVFETQGGESPAGAEQR